jgi:transposase
MAVENQRRRYDEEFKREAVRLTYAPGRTVAGVARDLGMNENNLWRWRKQFGRLECDNKMGAGSVEDELRRLRRQLARVTEERDILKKALSVFSRRDE